MKPKEKIRPTQIDLSLLDEDELRALEAWRVAEVIDRYNKEENLERAREYLQGLREMLEILVKAEKPIGPMNEKEESLIGSVLASVEFSIMSLSDKGAQMKFNE